MKDYRHISNVWLDLDDTLIDFHRNSDAALCRVYREWNLDSYYNNVGEWLDCYHAHNDKLWALYNVGAIDQPYLRIQRFYLPLVEAGVLQEDAMKWSKELDTVYLDYLASEKAMMPGAREALESLRGRGFTVGVLSNGFNGTQQKKLVSAGIDSLIDIVVLSDEIGVNKPDVRIYEYAMERSGVLNPDRHIMIGDNPDTDIAGALNAGWKAILYDSLGKAPDAPDYPVIDSLDQLMNILDAKNEL